ncbi:radical SAM protein [Neobittarella massiliensis]|uniref:Radical SAM protein n=1 Tax=Neobittarella massiliensis (ex Bilen et al. 2018) TaxID=2041842 RepID=A0A8J6IF20_9FIRM|nr:radical SAM protein [Neobittarella massiliensis]MBC3515975.1 radical SAM protein [Neobittarella massiliensis]
MGEDYRQLLEHCTLCPRRCGADRLRGETGYCGAGAAVRAGRAALHFWEEPCLSGDRGSGAVFFSGCTLGCVFCQNYQISADGQGVEVTVPQLAESFLSLQQQGAHNLNLVTATHYLPQVIAALDLAKSRGLALPVVYNCGGYERRETLRMLAGYVDIYLPDCKYLDAQLAARYSGAPDYPQVVREALDEMFLQVGEPVFDDCGMMRRGMIVRHLLLPGCEADSRAVLRYLYGRFGDSVYLSIMNQYTPLPRVRVRWPELGRCITAAEYERVIDYALELGIENAFVQEGGTVSESFIPDFSGQGLAR